MPRETYLDRMEAIKDLRAEIRELKAKLAKKEKELKELEERK